MLIIAVLGRTHLISFDVNYSQGAVHEGFSFSIIVDTFFFLVTRG